MTRSGIEAILDLMEEAFRGRGIEESNESQALITNLASVPAEAWNALPANAVRSVGAIALHVGACKIMYANHAFEDRALTFDSPEVAPWPEDQTPRDDLVPWLEAGHARLVAHVRALADDAELDRPRMTNWGEERPTRWIVAAMITHDAYHAGEINHLRSLLDGDDRWRYVQMGFG